LQAGIILGGVTILAILSWYFIPEDKWLRHSHVKAMLDAADHDVGDVVGSPTVRPADEVRA